MKKTKYIHLKVTEIEKTFLKQKSKEKAFKTVSQYLRSLIGLKYLQPATYKVKEGYILKDGVIVGSVQ